MAGFFGLFDYTKEGPGVPKDAPPKSSFVLFFEVYFRKFWNLIKINLMFNIFNLPATIIAFFIVNMLFPEQLFSEEMGVELVGRFFFTSFFLCLGIISVGPAQAGMTYLLRNYAREEHAFIWSDFKEHGLKNAKQSLLINLLDLLVLIIVFIDIRFYFSSISKFGWLGVFAGALMFLALILYIMMHMYIYPLMVTFKLKFKELLKDAFIFSIIKFLPNLLILALILGLITLTFWFPNIGIILFIFITITTINLIINFYVYPKMKKYIIDKMPEDEREN